MLLDIQISIIVLTYNRADALLRVLQGLAMQCGPADEVIIADDGSSWESVEAWQSVIPSFHCKVKHVWHPDVGFTASKARNLGAMVSHGQYIIFLDGDCIPSSHFMDAHRALAKSGSFVNGNRVLFSELLTARVLDGSVDALCVQTFDWIRWRLRGDINKFAHLLYWPEAPFRVQRSFVWKKIRSCNFALWKADFVRVNGFDESFEGWGHEDADLVLRLHNAGLTRINGYFGTEVFHLWHRQNSRDREGANYQRLLNRIKSNILQAVIGLNETSSKNDVVVRSLN